MDYKSGNIDLHIHSNASDGSLSPEQILQQAAAAGLAAIAITDHDTLDGVVAALKHGIPANLGFLTGVEISAGYPPPFNNPGSMHILGYGMATDDPALNRMLEKQQTARSGRNPRIIEKLNQLGMNISLAGVQSEFGKTEIGRPHIAEYMVKAGHAADIDDAFDRYLGKGRPAYVDKFRIPAADAIALIRNAGGMAALAHPGLLDNDGGSFLETLIKALIPMGLRGIEAYYPGHTHQQRQAYDALADRYHLVATGGTDFHGDINPEIKMGRGFGDLHIPYRVFERINAELSGS